jgi:raffinose/stachyose/melibiose transport system permease protein
MPLYVIVLLVTVVVLLPVVYAVLGGFRTTGQIAARPVALPTPWVFSNYREVLGSGSFWQQVGNSSIIAAITVLLIVALSAPAAFVFARFAFRGRELIYTFFTLGLLFPVAVAILPLFITVRQLGLLNTPIGVALPQAAFDLPLTIVILRPFFRDIPGSLEDAAAIDGASAFRFFWHIVLPMSRPALVTVAVLGIVKSWNAFLLPLVVLTDPSQWTLPLGVTNFSTQYSVDTARVLAFTTLSMVPTLIFYVFAERQLVSGLTSGAVKG